MKSSKRGIHRKSELLWRKVASVVIIGVFFSSFVFDCFAGAVGATQYDASQITNYLNISNNPCENFYAFACNNYAKKNITSMHELEKPSVDNYMTALIKNGTGNREFKPFKLIDDLYRTCMDDNAAKLEALALLDRILKKLGNWPVFENGGWKESDFDWIDFTIGSKKLGLDINYFLDLKPWRVMEANKTDIRYIIDIAPAEFKDPISNVTDPVVVAYAEFIQSVFALLKNKMNSSSEIREIIEFERQVSKINLENSNLDLQSRYTEKQTIEDLTKKWPTINWNELISNIIIRNLKTPVKITEISLWTSQAVSDFIQLVLKTPNHVKANYAVWKIIQKTIPYLTEKYRVLHREYCSVQACANVTRALSCVGVVKQHLAPAVNLLYARSYFNSDIEALVTDMIGNMKDELVRLINESSMDQQTKAINVERVRNKQFVIGFRGRDRGDEEFVEFYDSLQIDTSSYLQTLLDLELFAIENRFNEAKFDSELFESDFALRLYKKISLPWSDLRKPFFDTNYLLSVNYAYIGDRIAHELISSIDNLETVTEKNNEKNTCFRNQWLDIESKANNSKVMSQKTFYVPLNAQIVSQVSMKLAYLAYRRAAHNITERLAQQLTYTDRQLFWINWAQTWCTEKIPSEPKEIDNKYTKFEFFFSKILTSVPEFYADFKCSDESFIKNYGASCSYL